MPLTPDTITLHTAQYAKDVRGFGGPVPLQVHLSDGRIDSVTALPNSEDTQFFNRAKPLLHAWDGLTVGEAVQKDVDAVSGATYSSRAIIDGVRQTLTAYQAEQSAPSTPVALWGGLGALALLAALLLLRRRKRR